MTRSLISIVIAALVAGSAVMHSAVAQDRGTRTDRAGPDGAAAQDRGDRSGPTANQIAAESDARTARIRAELRLTADQEKNWPKLENALRDIGQASAQREVADRDEGAKQRGPEDLIAYFNRVAGALAERSADMKKLAEAAQPLHASLDDHQKSTLVARWLERVATAVIVTELRGGPGLAAARRTRTTRSV
jgi:hypothetical protein